MARGTWVYRNGKVVPKHSADRRSRHYVISDTMPDQLEHHGYADGRKTDSKSVFRQWTKAAGLVEKGNDRDAPSAQSGDVRSLKADVAQAIQMVRQGYRPQLRNIEGE